ncbi:MAG TPA: DUF423 domain-containing protein [Gemmatimonadales bacterium]|nr:DUF423 domain-containing protein [Gemmatimonadales bacterium]
MDRRFLLLGALSGFLAVAAGAFGAHALRAVLTPDLLAVFETGARYQMYHALALVLVAVVSASAPQRRTVAAAGWCFVVGTLLFSGSLYLLALTGLRWWGAVTPVGGVAFLAGWVCLGAAALGGPLGGKDSN